MSDFYVLWPGVDHLLPNEEQDALTINELDSLFGVGLADRDLTGLEPMPLRMTGTPIGRTDLLVGVSPFLVMTPLLLKVLESLGDFPHQVIPAHLVPDREDWREHPPIDTTSFVVCNLHQHVHVLDLDRCDLEPIEGMDDRLIIRSLVPLDGVTVPPLFRQDDWPEYPLIPESTRDAILAAGIHTLNMRALTGGLMHLNRVKRPR
jgi:hypothetical protein